MSLVSILIPTYNQPEFFKQALDSALNQTYSEIEIIVSDDSTDDRVKKICEEYIDSNSKFPIRYFKHENTSKENLGMENFLNALNRSHGEFINFLFHDDLFMPEKISRMMNFFNQDANKNLAFVTSRRYVIDPAGNVLHVAGLDDMNQQEIILSGNLVGQKILESCVNFVGELTATLIRREDLFVNKTKRFEVCRYFHLKNFSANADVPTFLELIRKKKNCQCVFINDPLCSFRRHFDQNGHDINIVLKTFFEWALMIQVSYSKKIFLTNTELLKNSCQSWLKLTSNILKDFKDVSNLEQQNFEKIDLLGKMIQACENADYKLFLKLTDRSLKK